eukprot:3465925-Rhodomonas_salina.1
MSASAKRLSKEKTFVVVDVPEDGDCGWVIAACHAGAISWDAIVEEYDNAPLCKEDRRPRSKRSFHTKLTEFKSKAGELPDETWLEASLIGRLNTLSADSTLVILFQPGGPSDGWLLA